MASRTLTHNLTVGHTHPHPHTCNVRVLAGPLAYYLQHRMDFGKSSHHLDHFLNLHLLTCFPLNISIAVWRGSFIPAYCTMEVDF